MLLRLLNKVGLTTITAQREAERREKKAEDFARAVADADDAAVIVGEDCVNITGLWIDDGRKILVVPGARYVNLIACHFGEKPAVIDGVTLPELPVPYALGREMDGTISDTVRPRYFSVKQMEEYAILAVKLAANKKGEQQ